MSLMHNLMTQCKIRFSSCATGDINGSVHTVTYLVMLPVSSMFMSHRTYLMDGIMGVDNQWISTHRHIFGHVASLFNVIVSRTYLMDKLLGGSSTQVTF